MVAQPVDTSETGRDGEGPLAGIPYRHEWIVASDLVVDPAYQYVVVSSWVDKIAAEFDPFVLDDLKVNRRTTGEYVVFDGKHRLYAIRKMGWGDQKVPCQLYEGLSLEMEAKLFNVQSVRRRLRPQEEFRAALLAGNPEAREIEAIVNQHGFRINLDDGELDGGRIPAVAALRRLYRRTRAGTLAEVLALVRDSVGTEHGPRHTVLTGLATFLNRFRGEYDRTRLIDVLRRASLGTLSAEGSDAAKTLGVNHDEGVAFALWKGYNHRLSDDRRLSDFFRTDGRKNRSDQ